MNRYGRIPVSAASGCLGKRALQVYIAISGRSVGGSFVSVASLSQLAADTGIDRRSLDRPIAELEGAGFLRAERHQGRKTRYTILFPERQLSAPEPTVKEPQDDEAVCPGADSELAQAPTVLSAVEPTHTESLQKTYRRAPARAGGSPDGRRRSRDPDEALKRKLHEEAFRRHGIWLPNWGEPPPELLATAA